MVYSLSLDKPMFLSQNLWESLRTCCFWMAWVSTFWGTPKWPNRPNNIQRKRHGCEGLFQLWHWNSRPVHHQTLAADCGCIAETRWRAWGEHGTTDARRKLLLPLAFHSWGLDWTYSWYWCWAPRKCYEESHCSFVWLKSCSGFAGFLPRNCFCVIFLHMTTEALKLFNSLTV